MAEGDFDFSGSGALFKAMLVTSTYSPNKDNHDRRNDVTNEVSGAGYTAGGVSLSVSVARNNTNDTTIITLASVQWPASTITARGCVYYQTNGLAADDRLVAYNDFGGNISSSGGTFAVAASTITLQN